ncbi:hypothetical protein [Phytopseudomonas punonensis]|uniref:Fibronectin type-III domain-containing protein n=1 Tax=Phytopseudomonas punonensis TaxID=1220495 RepID=A0A1M7LE22_9GAMM|nr:hypothetical protein [Pseudomonas punonensis]SHM76273.1 hypothetical protein SAMN05216288_4234 [Pseudomonas punonensis]
MTAHRPLVIVGGQVAQLPHGDTLDVPSAGAEDRIAAIYSGQMGGSSIEKSSLGVAFHADAQALLPALTTTVAAAPRDPVFVPTNWATWGLAEGSPISASGTAAGAQLVAGVGGSVQLTTGSTAAGSVIARFFQDALLTVPFDKVTAVRMTADFSIQALSVAAQRFRTLVGAYLGDALSLEVTCLDTVNSGAFTLAWQVKKSATETDSGSISTGLLPTAGVNYTVDIEASFTTTGGSFIARIRNQSTGVETTTTQAIPPLVYGIGAPALWQVSIAKSVGTTARTLRLNRARGYVLHAALPSSVVAPSAPQNLRTLGGGTANQINAAWDSGGGGALEVYEVWHRAGTTGAFALRGTTSRHSLLFDISTSVANHFVYVVARNSAGSAQSATMQVTVA